MSKVKGFMKIALEIFPEDGDDSYVQYDFWYDYTNKEEFDFDKVVLDVHKSLPDALEEFEEELREIENE
jgi:hypothetical protein